LGDACGRWRGAAGKARHRQIEATPEEMHGAGLADETGAKFLHHPSGLNKRLVEA